MGIARKTTTIRLPEELAATAEIVARSRGMSVNGLVVEALIAEIARLKDDSEVMEKLPRGRGCVIGRFFDRPAE